MTAPEKPVSGRRTLLVEIAGQQRKVALSRSLTTIGRADECDVVVPDPRVSRMHARIRKENGGFFVEDAGSRHGTFVNGTPCQQSPLQHKDVITLGVPGLSLTFLQEAPSSSMRDLLLTRIVSAGDSSELDQLRLFLEAARTLSNGGIVDDVLKRMLGYALRITRAERGFVYMADKEGRPRMTCGVDAAGSELLRDSGVAHSVVEEAMRSAAEFITEDATRQSGVKDRQSVLLNELRTLVAIPLRAIRVGLEHQARPQVDGVLYLDSRSVSESLHGISHDVLRALAGECAAVLESARLVEAEREQQLYQQEMAIAASIQHSLIARDEVRCDFARAIGQSRPCRQIGGDFFDVHVKPDALTALVADVSGKGISAALLASVIQGMFYAQITSAASLVDAISAINSFLCSRVAGQKYATLLAAQLRKGNTLQIVNCGHVPALIVQNGEIMQVDEGDLPVGLLPDATFHAVELPFPPGSRICMLTDGISEAENDAGLEFGMDRVKQHLLCPEPAKEILSAVQAFSGGRDPQDDQTLVLVEQMG